jgi:type IV pilus assembly protein PilC
VTRTVEAPGVRKRARGWSAKAFASSMSRRQRPTGVAALTRFGGAAAPRVKANDFLLFNQQLAALVRAGIPILQAISMLRKRAASARLRAVLGDVEEQIRGGAALSQAFASQGKHLSAHLHGFDSRRRTFGRARRSAERYVTTCDATSRCAERFAARSRIRCFCCLRPRAWSRF